MTGVKTIRSTAIKLCSLGYHVIPIKPNSKAAATSNWTSLRLTLPEHIDAHFPPDGNCGLGLLLGTEAAPSSFPVAIDIDLADDPLLVERIRLAFPFDPPCKKGAKGATFIVRSPSPLKKKRLTRKDAAGTAYLAVELLAAGQQTVLPPSVHPSGVPYVWLGSPLSDFSPSSLPVLDKHTFSEVELAVKDPDSPIFGLNEMTPSTGDVPGTVHDSILRAVASMVAHGWDDDAIWNRVDLAASRAYGDRYDQQNWSKQTRALIASAREKGFDEKTGKEKMALRLARWVINEWMGVDKIFNRDGRLTVYRDGYHGVLQASDARHVLMRACSEGLTHNDVVDVLNTVLDNAPRFPKESKPRVCLHNGTFCLDQMKLNPWSPDDFVISQLPFVYDASATCPAYEEFLLRTFNAGDPADLERSVNLFEEFISHTLFECLEYQKFLVLKGDTGTGKSTAIRIVRMLHSPHAVSAVGVQDFGNERFRAAMVGKLLNIASEVAATSHVADDFLKSVTAGDEVQIRYLYCEPETVRLSARLILACNEMFRTRDHSGAIERRMLILSCPNKVPDAEQDPWLINRIRMEMPGIFNRMVKAWARLRERGRFLPPESQKEQVLTFTEENNNVLQWVKDRTHQGLLKDSPDYKIPEEGQETENPLLYLDYAEWAKANGFKQMSSVSWGMRLSAIGVTVRTKRTGDRMVRMRPLGLLNVGAY